MPESGPEKLIYLRALQAFSDQCVPPELQPGCPFFEIGRDGPVCAEQCKDLLAEHARGPEHPGSALALRDGLAAHRRVPRPRPRRGPDREARAFDAREAYLADRDSPRDARSVPSMTHELQMLLRRPPVMAPDLREHVYEVQATYAELQRRGVDVESVVRYGMADTLTINIAMFAMAALLPPPEAQSNEEREYFAAVKAAAEPWHALLLASYASDKERGLHLDRRFGSLMRRLRALNDPLPQEPEREAQADHERDSVPVDLAKEQLTTYAMAGRFPERVLSWLLTCDIADLLDWKPPSSDQCLAEPAPMPASEKAIRGRWLLDRFTKTYLDDWQDDSLSQEWRYLHGNCTGCDPRAMSQRVTEASEVAAQLADRTTSPKSAEEAWERLDEGAALFQFVQIAADILRAGRREEAVALYRGLVRMHPDNPDVNNNYGFCLLPDAPEAGLQWLERAAALRSGGDLDGTNLANRLYALHRLGRHEEALALASQLTASDAPVAFPFAFLWRDAVDGPVLGERVDTQRYCYELAHAAARKQGDEAAEAGWAKRLFDLDDRPG